MHISIRYFSASTGFNNHSFIISFSHFMLYIAADSEICHGPSLQDRHHRMKQRDLERLGIPRGETMKIAVRSLCAAKGTLNRDEIREKISGIVAHPDSYAADPVFGKLAGALANFRTDGNHFQEREHPAPFRIWGQSFEEETLNQMENACRLPVTVRGALMPDGHVGYGLPIGGVLATRNSVIPHAVGVDIACRMKMTVLDLPASSLDQRSEPFRHALTNETYFGMGATRKKKSGHPVMDSDWKFSAVTKKIKDRAWSQLGTSGSGNHFVEFGILTVEREDFLLRTGTYLALLSHSGSRGPGNEIARYYSSVAQRRHTGLPPELRQLAWLSMESQEGAEYWKAMQLMGEYASANHEIIHKAILRNLGAKVLLEIENHHNFAWKEVFDNKELIIHRKGATPAALDQLGIIPGSMGTPAFIVRGKGNHRALNSAAHGAGRKISRKEAKKRFSWSQTRELLKQRKITLLSAGLDESPMAYKDIEEVMRAQSDLVEIMAFFEPRIVKMAPEGERAED